MTFRFLRISQFLLVVLLSLGVTFPETLFAQDHVVSSSDLRKDLQQASAAREQKLVQLDQSFSSAEGQEALRRLHIGYQQVDKAARSLSDDDLARLAARSQGAQKDFAAGKINSTDLLWIIVGVLVIILIIVAVRH